MTEETLVTVRSRESGIDGRVVRWFIRYSGEMPWLCTYCGEAEAEHMDHIVPRSKGGQNIGNLTPACAKCNMSKKDRTPERWIAAMLRRMQEGQAPPRYHRLVGRLLCPMSAKIHAYRFFYDDYKLVA